MRRRFNATGLAAVLAVVATLTVVVYWWNWPSTLRVVVPNLAAQEQRLFGSFADILRRDRAGVRLELLGAQNAADAVATLTSRRADLAVLRLDAAPLRELQAVALLRREPLMVVVPRGSPVTQLSDLRGKTLGLARATPANEALAREMLEQNGVDPASVALVPLAYGDVGMSVREKKVHAVLLVNAPSLRFVQDVVADVAREGRGEPTFLAVEMAEAVSGRSPRMEMTEIPARAYGGSQPRPSEAVSTVAVAVRLMARPDASEAAVSELLETLLAARQRLVAADNPVAALIEPPDTDADATVPVHRGAAAHLNGDKRGFLDRYSDWFYFLLFAASLGGSAFAGLMGLGTRKQREETNENLERLARLINEARGTTDADALDKIEQEASAIVVFSLHCASERLLEQTDATALQVGLEELRTALARARREGGVRRLAAAE